MKSLVPAESIEKKILLIRGQKVILDKDLAEIYGVSTSRLNEQARRNLKRFPSDFMFQLTKEEMENWKSQIAISKSITMGLRKRPHAFTEHGAVQAANVLNSDRAVEMGVAVVRAFVRMRELIIAHKDLAVRLDDLEKKYDTRFKFVFDAIKKLIDSPAPAAPRPIGFLSDEQKDAAANGRVAVKEGGLVYVNSLKLSGHEDVAGIFYDLKNQDREKFVTLMLNKDDEILGCEVVSVGTLDSALVHPREVLKIPVNIGAAKIALIHNHPSGDHCPSEADIKLTKRLSIAAKIVGIEVLYHVVIGRDKYSVFNDVLDASGQLLKAPEVYPIIRYESQSIAHPEDKPFSLKPIKSPADVVEFARPLFDKDEPLAVAVFLDSRKNVTSVQMLGAQYDEGWASRLARAGIAANAADYIICSNFDISNEKLKGLVKSSETMGVPLLDCVILDKDNKSEYISSKKRDGVVNETTNKTMSESVTENSDSAPRAQEGKGMLKVAERAAKGTYVARITGVDDHLNVQREFLKTELKFGDKKGGAEVFIDPETLKEGDIISMKVVRAAGDKPEEKFYKIVSDPGKSRELHNVVKKILGGKEEVAKMLLRNTLVEGRKLIGSKNLIVAADVSADKKSYVAKIVGADEKFGFKREFIGEHKELAGGAGPGQKLEISGDSIKEGDIIAVKIVKVGEDPKVAKETFYRVEKDPADALELREVARKITREEAAKALGIELKAAGRMAERTDTAAAAAPDKPAEKSFGKAEVTAETGKHPGLTVVSDIQKGAYVAKLTGPDEKFGFKREFIGKKVWDEEKKWCLRVSLEDIPKGTVIAAKDAGGKDVKETYYRVAHDPVMMAESYGHPDQVLEKITKEEAAALVTGKSKTSEDVKKNSPEMSGPAEEAAAGNAEVTAALEREPAETQETRVEVKSAGRTRTYGRTM